MLPSAINRTVGDTSRKGDATPINSRTTTATSTTKRARPKAPRIGDKLNTLRSCITSSMKTQVEYQMKSFMDSLQANLKAQHLELQEAMETIDDESDGIQFVIKSCANLSNSLQGVLFDFDAFERTLWTRMEHAKSPAKTN